MHRRLKPPCGLTDKQACLVPFAPRELRLTMDRTPPAGYRPLHAAHAHPQDDAASAEDDDDLDVKHDDPMRLDDQGPGEDLFGTDSDSDGEEGDAFVVGIPVDVVHPIPLAMPVGAVGAAGPVAGAAAVALAPAGALPPPGPEERRADRLAQRLGRASLVCLGFTGCSAIAGGLMAITGGPAVTLALIAAAWGTSSAVTAAASAYFTIWAADLQRTREGGGPAL
jgi:hypothetical protein